MASTKGPPSPGGTTHYKDTVIAARSVIGSYGGGSYVTEDDKAKASGGIPYDMPDGDKTLVCFETETGGLKVMTVYQMVRTAEDKGIVKYNVSCLELAREEKGGGSDSFTVKRTSPNKFFKFGKEDAKKDADGKKVAGEQKMFYRDIDANLLPNADLVTVFKFRYEKVGKNFKPMKVYVANKRSITLKAGRPKKVV